MSNVSIPVPEELQGIANTFDEENSASSQIKISAKDRSVKGKGQCHRLRKLGFLPANLLEKGKSTSLVLHPKWLSKAWKGGKEFKMEYAGKTVDVRIHELQIDPVKRLPLHVDLIPTKAP